MGEKKGTKWPMIPPKGAGQAVTLLMVLKGTRVRTMTAGLSTGKRETSDRGISPIKRGQGRVLMGAEIDN